MDGVMFKQIPKSFLVISKEGFVGDHPTNPSFWYDFMFHTSAHFKRNDKCIILENIYKIDCK